MRIIAGEARGRIIEAPAGLHTRPTLDRVRENLFNMIQNEVPESRILDLFAGSGALSLEALSRGASCAVMNDIDRNACAVQKKNIALLRYDNRVRQYRGDWHSTLLQLQEQHELFDLVFLDPPYSMLDLSEVFSCLVPVISSGSLVILEHEAGKQPETGSLYRTVKNRSWGVCGVTIYQLITEGA